MNNGCLTRPKKAVLAMRGGSLRSVKPQRQARYNTESLGNIYAFSMSDNITQDAGIGGLVNSVQASSETGAYFAWKAFDKRNVSGENGWSASAGAVSWLRVNFNYPIIVRRVDIVAHADYFTYAPKTFTIEGSNDGGSVWDVLATYTNIANWTAYERRAFTYSCNTAYSAIRVYITLIENVAYGNGAAQIGEMEFYD